MSKHTASYFIKKFSSIPEELWSIGHAIKDPNGACCALGHLGSTSAKPTTRAAMALDNLCMSHFDLTAWAINDACTPAHGLEHMLGDTPKQRILAALELIQAGVSV